VRSEAPRPIVVTSLSVLTPWNPAITQTLPSLRDWRTRSPLTSTILALRWAVSVMMPTWLPVKLIASIPRSASAIVISAAVWRSPVVSSMSISRPGWVRDTELASEIRLSVALPIADTTTITSLPRFLVKAMLSATAWMRSGSATEVPPYFWTISATSGGGYKPVLPGPRCIHERVACQGFSSRADAARIHATVQVATVGGIMG